MEESKTEICMLRRRIAELEKEKQADKEKIKELEADNYECNNIIRDYIEDWKFTKNYIHKNEIKRKIEECREILYSFEKELELKANKDKFIYKGDMNRLLGQISILQSLLEGEE